MFIGHGRHGHKFDPLTRTQYFEVARTGPGTNLTGLNLNVPVVTGVITRELYVGARTNDFDEVRRNRQLDAVNLEPMQPRGEEDDVHGICVIVRRFALGVLGNTFVSYIK